MLGLNKKPNAKKSYIIAGITALFVFFTMISITYASIEHGEPDVIINIDDHGNCSCYGNLFTDDLWYPGKEVSGIIRITSDIEAKITSIGLDINILNHKPSYSQEKVYESFKNSMKMTIIRNQLLIFSNAIIKDESLPVLATNDGYALPEYDQFNIGMGSSADLYYTLKMDNEAGDELERIAAAVTLKIDLEQN